MNKSENKFQIIRNLVSKHKESKLIMSKKASVVRKKIIYCGGIVLDFNVVNGKIS